MRSSPSRWSEMFGRRESPASTGSTFLLGAGAHLAGVTSLHRYLAASPQCEPGPHREYHVLDSAGLPSEQWVRDLLLDRAQQSLEAVRTHGRASGKALLRAAMIADADIYFDFFAGLLGPPDISLAMDLTPDHSLLASDQIAAVRQGFADRGVRTAAVFVMRDPLDRIVTHIRLQQKQRPEQFPGSLESWVERLYADPTYERRTRYDRTIAALDDVFEAGSVWFGFHERLMTGDSLLAISDLCRIDYRQNDRPAPRTASTPTAGLPNDLAREVVGHYREVYESVADRFGLDDLSGLWPSSRFAL